MRTICADVESTDGWVEVEAKPDPEQSEMDDMAAALALLGVTPEEG